MGACIAGKVTSIADIINGITNVIADIFDFLNFHFFHLPFLFLSSSGFFVSGFAGNALFPILELNISF